MASAAAGGNPIAADLVLRGGDIRPTPADPRVEAPPGRSMAVRDGRVVAVAAQPDDLDALVGADTVAVDARGLTVLPGFFDSHNHQLWTAADLDAVQLDHARSLDAVLDAVAAAAAHAEPDEWIVCSRSWHESLLTERRLPRAEELDRAAPAHPVYLPRGAHVVVTNTRGLARAGIDADASDPPGGTRVRDADGALTGVLLEPPAFDAVMAQLPPVSFGQRVDQLARTSAAFAARGITAVRDPGVARDGFRVYHACDAAGRLTVRSTVMLRLEPAWSVADKLAELDAWPVATGFGHDRLHVGGAKLFLDGGVEAAALSSGYANDPDFAGHLFTQPDDLATVVAGAVQRGWHVGCHAVGEVAIDAAVTAYERTLRDQPDLDPRALAVEHAFFATADHARRMAELGIPVTVQHPLLYFLAGNMLTYWGEARTERVNPLRDLLDAGVRLAAGSDSNIAPYDPLLAMWGLVSRQTAMAGARGANHALTRAEALRLSTTAGSALLPRPARRDGLMAGRLADVVALAGDPLTCDLDDLPAIEVALTIAGGEVVFDPAGRARRPTDDEEGRR